MPKGTGSCLTVSWGLPRPGSHASNPGFAFFGGSGEVLPCSQVAKGSEMRGVKGRKHRERAQQFVLWQPAICFPATPGAREKQIGASFPSERQRFASALRERQSGAKLEALGWAGWAEMDLAERDRELEDGKGGKRCPLQDNSSRQMLLLGAVNRHRVRKTWPSSAVRSHRRPSVHQFPSCQCPTVDSGMIAATLNFSASKQL